MQGCWQAASIVLQASFFIYSKDKNTFFPLSFCRLPHGCSFLIAPDDKNLLKTTFFELKYLNFAAFELIYMCV